MNKQAVIGGAFGGGAAPRQPITTPDSIRSESKIEIVEAWQWGEIAGFPNLGSFVPIADDPDPAGILRCIYLDDTPIRAVDGSYNFDMAGIEFDYRHGTQDQSYIPGTPDFGNDAIGSPISVSVPVTHSVPITRTINDPSTDAVLVILTFQGLKSQNTSNGDINAITVNLRIEARAQGGAWTTIIDPAFKNPYKGKIKEKTEAPCQFSYLIDLKSISTTADSYDVRVTRISEDPAYNQVSAFTWDSYIKLTYAKFRRPNIAHCRIVFDAKYFSKIPSRKYLLDTSLVYVPTADVYDPANRTYTGADWNGTLTKAFCTNPAWCLYYLLVTPGHGLGSEINPAYQDKWIIYQLAKRCDERVPNGSGGTEPRYSLNVQFMEQVSAHEMITQLSGVFDAMALWDGKSVYIAQDAPKPVSSLYVPANVTNGKFNYVGTARQVRYTAALIQYNDTTDMYRIQPEPVEDLSGIERYGYKLKTEAMVGCTSRAEAHRRGKRLLASGRLETDAVSFSVGLGGINDKIGDVIRIADPLRSAGERQGGRISTGSTTTVVQLDAPVVLSKSTGLRLAIIDNDGNVRDSGITSIAGETSAIHVSPGFPSAPETEMMWIVYDPIESGKLYRILGIKESEDDGDGYYSISATQYAPEKYTLIDDLAELPALPVNPYITTSVEPPAGIITTEGTIVALDGIKRFLDISWSASAAPLLRGYIISYSFNGSHILDKEVQGLSYRIENLEKGDYDITLSAITLTGKYSASITVTYSAGDFYDITAVSITNLRLPSGNNQFIGKDAFFSWDTNADAVLSLSDSYSTGTGGQNPLFRDFEIRIYNGSTLLRTEYRTEYFYTYTFEKNAQDTGPHRAFTIKVRARDLYGHYSQESTLDANNPPPGEFSAISLDAGIGQIFVNYTRPADNDYQLTRIYASQIGGFNPSDTNLVAESTASPASFKVNGNGTWYVRLQGVDAFGPYGTTYTPSIAVDVVSDIALAVDEVLSDPGRAGDVIVEANRFLVVEPGQQAPVTSVFGVALVNGLAKVAIRGDIVADGSMFGRSLAVNSVSADRMNVSSLSSITANIGYITAGALNINSRFFVANDGTVTIYNSYGDLVFASGVSAFYSATHDAKLAGIESGATVGATSSNLRAGVGKNLIPNANFDAGIDGWIAGSVESPGSNYIIGRDLGGATYTPAGTHTLGLARTGAAGVSAGYMDVYRPGWLMSVEPSTPYELFGDITSHRCLAGLVLSWVNADGSETSTALNRSSTVANGGNKLSLWEHVAGFFTSPVNAVAAYVFFRSYATTSSDPFSLCTKLFFGKANPGQTEHSPWSPGGAGGAFSELDKITAGNADGYLDPDSIDGTYVANLHAGKVTAGYLSAARLDAGTTYITSELMVAGGTITVPENATGSAFLPSKNADHVITQLTPVLVSRAINRIILITIQITAVDSDPGFVMLRLYTDGTYQHEWPFDISGRQNGGSHDITFSVTHTIPYSANDNRTLVVKAGAYDGSGSHVWAAVPGLTVTCNLIVFTGKA